MSDAGRAGSSALALLVVLTTLLGCSREPPPSAPRHPAASTSPTVEPPRSTPLPSITPVAPQQAEPPLPLQRQEVASATLPGPPERLYVVGGFDSARASSHSVEVFSDHWVAGPDYPLAIDHPAAATLGDRLYVAGGFSNGQARADVFMLSSTGSWQAAPPLHHPRGALALVAIGGRLFAIGGRASAAVAAVEVFEPARQVWTDAGTLPQPRDHLAGFAWQGRACVAGGRSPDTARVDCLDPEGGSWTRLPDLPFPTSGAGAAFLGDEVVVAGGEDSAESRLVGRVFRLRADAWSDEPMLVARHGIQLAVFHQRAWACGGATAAGYQAVVDCTSIS